MLCIRQTLRNQQKNYSRIKTMEVNKIYNEDCLIACCKICDYVKNTMTIEEFKEWIAKVYEHLTKINAQNA